MTGTSFYAVRRCLNRGPSSTSGLILRVLTSRTIADHTERRGRGVSRWTVCSATNRRLVRVAVAKKSVAVRGFRSVDVARCQSKSNTHKTAEDNPRLSMASPVSAASMLRRGHKSVSRKRLGPTFGSVMHWRGSSRLDSKRMRGPPPCPPTLFRRHSTPGPKKDAPQWCDVQTSTTTAYRRRCFSIALPGNTAQFLESSAATGLVSTSFTVSILHVLGTHRSRSHSSPLSDSTLHFLPSHFLHTPSRSQAQSLGGLSKAAARRARRTTRSTAVQGTSFIKDAVHKASRAHRWQFWRLHRPSESHPVSGKV